MRTFIQSFECSHFKLVHHLFESAVDRDLENKPVTLSPERIRRTFISPFFGANVCRKALTRYILFYLILWNILWVMLYVLHYLHIKSIALQIKFSRMRCIMKLNCTHSLLSSWITIVWTWFEEVVIMNCFVDRQI